MLQLKQVLRCKIKLASFAENLELQAQQQGYLSIIGVDEAGRGPLAGPVVAAACLFNEALLQIPGINDSKQLTPKKRAKIYAQILESEQVIVSAAVVDADRIDKINILQATIEAMIQAVDAMPCPVDYLLVDGLKLPHNTVPGEKVIKGDARAISIAAASIVAKEVRDQIMLNYHNDWPDYGFDRHKGYGTQFHREQLYILGPCEIHRRSFEPVKSLVSI